DTNGPQVFIRVDGAYDSVQAIADTPIVAAGRTLKLADIADVRRGYEDPPTYLIRHQGEPSIMLAAVMQEGWDGLALGKALEERSAAIARTLPLGMSLAKVSDQDRKSTRLNSSHVKISYAVFCLKKKNIKRHEL